MLTIEPIKLNRQTKCNVYKKQNTLCSLLGVLYVFSGYPFLKTGMRINVQDSSWTKPNKSFASSLQIF